jgi:predicted anti-sigma-YlaC factor YlaD
VNCKKVFLEVSNYLDGDIDPEVRATIEHHMKLCHHCQVVVDTMRKTIELYCDGQLFPLPETVRDRLHDVLRRRCGEEK